MFSARRNADKDTRSARYPVANQRKSPFTEMHLVPGSMTSFAGAKKRHFVIPAPW
jgi:hypothetical protein